MTKKTLTLVLFLAVFENWLWSQVPDNPVEHMSALSEREELLQKKYLSYMSEVAHGERARKMEKRRNELITSIQEAIREGSRLRPYKGDPTLRNVYVEYWNVLLHIFKEDYHKIVDMEEVAERSYDMMEAYLLAQEKVDEKLHQAYVKVSDGYRDYAAKHSVTLTEGQETKLSRKMEQIGLVNNYMNQLFLIYFKSSVQDTNLSDLLKANDINGVEQTKNALLKYSTEGLQRLDTVKAFKGDGSMITACRKVLEFHRAEAEKNIPIMANYMIKADEFNKIKKSYESKPANKRTQADIDAFNKAVDDINKHAQLYNTNAEELNSARNKVITNWNQTRKRFMDQHIPYK